MARRARTRWNADNDLGLNPWAFLVVGLVALVVVLTVVANVLD